MCAVTLSAPTSRQNRKRLLNECGAMSWQDHERWHAQAKNQVAISGLLACQLDDTGHVVVVAALVVAVVVVVVTVEARIGPASAISFL